MINALQDDEFVQSIVSLTVSTDFKKRLASLDTPIVELGKAQGKDLKAYAGVWRAIRSLRPDIVHTHNLPTIDMILPAKLAGAKRVVHGEHGLDMYELGGREQRYSWLRWGSQFLVDRYVAVSHDLADRLIEKSRIPRDKVSTIYNGVDTSRFDLDTNSVCNVLGLPDWSDKFVIGHIGRLETIKNQTLLARAFCRMLQLRRDLRPQARLMIIGDGTLRAEINGTLHQADAQNLAWLPGYRDDVDVLYHAMSLFVLPSRREGISNTLLEAMACGLPVIATNVGGNPEVVIDGETGTLVPPDDTDAMAAALISCIDNPGLAGLYGRAGRDRVMKEFSLDAMVARYDALYRSL